MSAVDQVVASSQAGRCHRLRLAGSWSWKRTFRITTIALGTLDVIAHRISATRPIADVTATITSLPRTHTNAGVQKQAIGECIPVGEASGGHERCHRR
ncbi:hypothetical protein [Pseudofrankia asymbiotica]|uniref:Uncharacterized protein n=1 Tax=Pseudofrankia asymbiotica TaxID=1834516 RepID=A0A1V2I032_9ACTN|nr:hypothetical protein [Pseudofrankia asymbiotica]ONH22637.1 hypothetical protein BL253_35030 [Pseudofrankia asymbiotica]